MRRLLYKWKAYTLDLENAIQMQAMAFRFTRKTYVASLFFGWRIAIKQAKFYRQSLLGRVLRYLKVNVVARKQMRCQALMLLRESRVRRNDALLKSCYDGLRHHKQSRKLLKVKHELLNVELPLQKKTGEDIERHKVDFKLKQRNYALTNVLHIKVKKVFQYFKKWRDETEHHHLVIQNEIKSKLIRRYKWVLSQAF